MANLKMRVVLQPNGQIDFFADEGSFGDAKDKIEFLMQALEVAGIDLSKKSQVEAHRHDNEGQHVHAHGPHTHTHAETGHTH